MSLLWFKRWGWIYRPVHPIGYALLLGALAFAINAYVAVDRHSHSASDTLYHAYVYLAPTFLGLMWLASRSSDERKSS